ncbi:MAG: TonB-dependent receptor plug domain-containing protein [Sediminibacterium sp.]|nr:TonB-dependent receptor plug domain-containing protein [Sediminibacterium sp.]MDP3128839.1 TonB-dependent receptor plug domain-containing protein [Sediminibacterium sp.]
MNLQVQKISKKTSILFLWMMLCFNPISQIFSQTTGRADVSGALVNEKGDPVQGATIRSKNMVTQEVLTTFSNEKGLFIFKQLMVGSKYDVTASYIGYEDNTYKNFTVKQGLRNSLFIKMKESNNMLEDLVVVGYGSQKKVNLTGAVDQVGGEYFEDRPSANITRSLQGAIPNLNIKIVDGKPTRSAIYNVRGTTSIGSGGSALVLIDGVPGDPATLNPNDIETVSVLKDASSAAIYGARGAFGVVLITTKSPKLNKIQVSYHANYSINQRTTTPDLVSDSYIWAKNFDESFYSWNDYLSHPQSINSQLGFSLAYLDSLKAHSENPGLLKAQKRTVI